MVAPKYYLPYITISYVVWQPFFQVSLSENSNVFCNSLKITGIFNWALEGYNRLRSNKFRFQEADSMRVAKQKYRIERDSVWAFITENLIKTNENDKIKL